MFRATTGPARAGLRRFFASKPHNDAPASTQTEIDATKVLGMAVLAGISLYFYRSTKQPVFETGLLKYNDERVQLRNEAYLKRYKISFIKSFMRDNGGYGQRQFKREAQGAIPQTLIHAPSPYGDQFGAGIKTNTLGPRRERVKYFAPLET